MTSLLNFFKYDKTGFDNTGLHRLHNAAANGDLADLKELLNQGCSVDLKTKKDHCYTALYLACKSGHEACILELLNRGASVDQMNDDWTSLMRAAFAGHVGCTKLLLDHKAGAAIQSTRRGDILAGKTAVDFAKHRRHKNVVALFESRTASTLDARAEQKTDSKISASSSAGPSVDRVPEQAAIAPLVPSAVSAETAESAGVCLQADVDSAVKSPSDSLDSSPTPPRASPANSKDNGIVSGSGFVLIFLTTSNAANSKSSTIISASNQNLPAAALPKGLYCCSASAKHHFRSKFEAINDAQRIRSERGIEPR